MGVPPLDSQAPPLTRGNASYCGFQAYLGRTPRNHSDEDTDLDGRDHLADRLSDEVDWLRQCAGWLRQLDGGGYPAGGDEGPSAGWPDRAVVAAGLARVAAVIDRIAADVDELARARLHRQPVPATLTTIPVPPRRQGSSGNWTP